MVAIWATARGSTENGHLRSGRPGTLRMRSIYIRELDEVYAQTPLHRLYHSSPITARRPERKRFCKTCRHEIAHVSHRYIPLELPVSVVVSSHDVFSRWKKKQHPFPTLTGINFASLGREACVIVPYGYISFVHPRGKHFFPIRNSTSR